jgi:hypothetical protein
VVLTAVRVGAVLAAAATSLAVTTPALAEWHQPAGVVSDPSLPGGSDEAAVTSVGGTPYVTWGGPSQDSPGFRAIWIARLAADGTAWTDVPGPFEAFTNIGAARPSIGAVGNVPYVAYSATATSVSVLVRRPNAAGTGWVLVGTFLDHDANADADDPSLATLGGVPYVAWVEDDMTNREVRVARLNSAGTGWDELIGGNAASPINRSGAGDAQQPSMADVGGVPYVAWSENDGTNFEIRVARYEAAGDHWPRLEPPLDNVTWGGINESRTRDATNPSLTSVGGVPYVAWSESDGINTEIRVARLNSAGAWEQVVGGASPINESATANASHPSIADFNGVPFVSWDEAGQIRVAKLSDDGNSWEKVADAASPINEDPAKSATAPSLANVAGTPYVAWEEPDASSTQVRASRLEPEFQSQAVTPGSTTAELSATWRTYGIPFPIGFDYGASLESATTATPAPAGQGTATVTQQVTGLSPSSVYQLQSFTAGPPKLLAPNATVFQTAAAPSDTTAPETTITKEPRPKSSKSKAKYKFTSSEPNSTFTCKFDKAKPKPCDAGKAKFKHLDDGKHKFSVIATDAAGNADVTPAKDKFKVI